MDDEGGYNKNKHSDRYDCHKQTRGWRCKRHKLIMWVTCLNQCPAAALLLEGIFVFQHWSDMMTPALYPAGGFIDDKDIRLGGIQWRH